MDKTWFFDSLPKRSKRSSCGHWDPGLVSSLNGTGHFGLKSGVAKLSLNTPSRNVSNALNIIQMIRYVTIGGISIFF